MTEYARPIDVATSAELRQLAEQVQKTHQPIPLIRNDRIVAVIQPVPAVNQASEDEPALAQPPHYPTLESLAGAAGALPEPQLSKTVLQQAREHRLAKKFPPRNE